jgi:hypothetical protein
MLNHIIFLIGCIFYLIVQKLATNFCSSYHPDAPVFSLIIGTIFAILFDLLYWVTMARFHLYSI